MMVGANMKTRSKTDRLFEALEEQFVKWAETRSDIRAALVVGSRARRNEPADKWADLDVIVVTSEPEYYVSSSDWINNMGKPLLTFVEPTASGGEKERRVLYEGMLDVDFTIFPVERIKQILQAERTPEFAMQLSNALGRGMRVLIDKDGTTARLNTLVASIEAPSPRPPAEQEFLQVVNDFLYHAVWTAKHLLRGELWWAKMCSDCYMQHLLLRMIEWHARGTHGWNYNIWFRGRFLENWADKRVVEGLRGAFAHYNEDDIKRALLAIIDLFRWTAMETAQKLSYPYPLEAHEQVAKWVKTQLQKPHLT